MIDARHINWISLAHLVVAGPKGANGTKFPVVDDARLKAVISKLVLCIESDHGWHV